MQYGIKIYDANGLDITGALTPIFYIASVTSPSGYRDFSPRPQGKSLMYILPTIFNAPSSSQIKPDVTVSGASVTWSNLSNGRIIFYWG